MSQIIIGTAGHIDHGKTTLVEALTGTNTDRLPAERERGMTIDLGFAFLTDDITIIDVPGHERFIRNMVAGVRTIDIALVTIAADDGIMPQTREHVDILSLLGVKSGCIAVTKIDLIEEPDWLDLLEEDIRDYVKGSFLESAPLIRVSGQTGQGVEELRTVLLRLASHASEKSDRGFFRLFVDRAFSMKGFGTVVTGTVVGGSAKEGDELEVLPERRKVKIRALQSHGENVPGVALGDRAALNLSGVDRSTIRRGCQIVTPGFLKPTRAFGADITLLPGTDRFVRHEQRVRVHVGTDEVMGRVFLCNGGKGRVLEAEDRAPALIRLESWVAVAMEDPVILRFYSPPETIGGGVIVDPDPPSRLKVAKQWLSSIAHAVRDERMEKFLGFSADHPLTLREWAQRWQFSEEKVMQLLDKLDVLRFGSSTNPHITLRSAISTQENLYLATIQESHGKSAYRKGVPKDELRQRLGLSQPLFDFLTERLQASKRIDVHQGFVSDYTFRIELSEEDRALANRVEDMLRRSDLTPPTLTDLAAELNLSPSNVLPILHLLKDMGKAREVDRNLWFHTKSLDILERSVRSFFESRSSLSVGDFKIMTLTTRKHAIPLLEYLDRREVTRRDGNVRVLNL